MDRVEQIALKMEGVADTIRFDGLNPLTQVNQANSGAVYVVLKHWEERKAPELRARALVGRLQQELSGEITEALALVFRHRRSGPGDHRRVRVRSRIARAGSTALADVADRFMARRGSGPSCRPLHSVLGAPPASLRR
jgi:multidrug efflux pump